MGISKKMEEALNKQLTWEFYSAYLYLSMSAYFESIKLKGFAHWMRKQAEEETEHGMRIFHYVAERKGRVCLGAIEKPKEEWESPEAVIENALEHEKGVTKKIHDLVELAKMENDPATEEFLQWFVKEQAEEESTADRVLQETRQAGNSEAEMSRVDSELAQRK